MKLFMSSIGFLILLLMLSAERSQAIRLLSKMRMISPNSLHYQVNVNEKRCSLFKEESGAQGGIRYGLSYGHCSGRKSRQLMTTLDKGTNNDSSDEKEHNPNKEKKTDLDRKRKEIHRASENHTYLDHNQDIEGMDYSPAQKKPPIHN